MTKPPSLPQTEVLTVKAPSATKRLTDALKSKLPTPEPYGFGHMFVGAIALVAALLTANQATIPLNANLPKRLERQAQTLFFELRGPVPAPSEIVILALDEDSLVQGSQIYPSDPQKYAYLEPLRTSPPRRIAYARVIDRVMGAGAKAIALDVLFDAPGSSATDDQQLQAALQRYAGRVTLAAKYDSDQTFAGDVMQLILPNPLFQTASSSVGFINFFPEPPNNGIYLLGDRFPKLTAANYPPEQAKAFLQINAATPSFAQATLQAAQLFYPNPHGQNIFYYGPPGTFQQVPFWHVLDPTNWKTHLKNGTFRDKIVLIGATARIYQDFHVAPFAADMPGVEIQASAIATLLENKSIADAIPNLPLQGLFVFTIVAGAGYLQSRAKRSLRRFALALGLALVWGGIAYVIFTQGRLILPTAVPMAAIVLSGTGYLFIGVASEKFKLRRTIKDYIGSPLIQEIISKSQQDELKDLLPEFQEQEFLGKILQGRYRIKQVLGAGGFGETYTAEDMQRPGQPICVVKHLRPTSNNPKLFQLANRLFQREAETLEKLGRHGQIPQLLAYFEENQEFYLIQEFISGQPLSNELSLGKQLSEAQVLEILREILTILEFVHSFGVIHRDIKPNNIIRRKVDSKLVLIDFGAVKEVSQIGEDDRRTGLTVGIGTQGYMPNEQCAGNPQFNSDIYALGMMGIQALTGLAPSQLVPDKLTAEITWRHRAQVSYPLAEVLNKMVRYDFRHRYQSATEVLQALHDLKLPPASAVLAPSVQLLETNLAGVDGTSHDTNATSTRPWPDTFGLEQPHQPTAIAPDDDTASDPKQTSDHS